MEKSSVGKPRTIEKALSPKRSVNGWFLKPENGVDQSHAHKDMAWGKSLRAFGNFLLNLLFPKRCLGCQAEGAFVCADCLARIPDHEYQECPLCRTPYAQAGAVCRQCRGQTVLDGLLVAHPYRHPLLERLVHTFKYRFIEELASPLASLIERSLSRNALALPDMIVPVPLHARRLRFRGFNQAALLAEALAAHLTPQLPLPVAHHLLERIRFTPPQMQAASKIKRERNLSGAFALNSVRQTDLEGKYVWLIDDIATTGTTLEECAKVLKQGGAKSVWGVVIAR